MNDTALIQRLEAKIDRLDRKLSAILGEQKKKSWVKVGTITGLTGWDRSTLQRMRENGLIEFKRDATGIWYDLNSIPKDLIKEKRAL